jgi:hypothetical protein
MASKIGELIISRATVEAIGEQEIGQLTIGWSWRKDVWQKPHKFIQMVSIQIVGAVMVFTAMMLPIDRLLSVYRVPNSQIQRFTQLIWVDGIVTTIIVIAANRWIFLRGRRLQNLLKLVEQIDRYNQIVTSIETIEKVTDIATIGTEASSPAGSLEILSKTRQNLLIALEIDKYLRQYPDSAAIALTIANNLIDLQHLAKQTHPDEYGILLDRAWAIGASIYEEIKIS